MKYAKLVSETSIDTNVPNHAVYEGRAYSGDLSVVPGLLESLGYYLVEESEEPTPQTGYHEEKRYAYDDAENPTKIVQTWVQVEDPPAPPRVFSKLKLKGAIAQAGLLSAFKDMLSGMEVATGYSALEAFNDAVNLSEAHPKFADAIAVAKQTLPVTDEQIEAILAASVAD